jgi:hypothetical protein
MITILNVDTDHLGVMSENTVRQWLPAVLAAGA